MDQMSRRLGVQDGLWVTERRITIFGDGDGFRGALWAGCIWDIRDSHYKWDYALVGDHWS